MNYLTINIGLVIASATILQLLLFKKGQKESSMGKFQPRTRYALKIAECISIILILGSLVSIKSISDHREIFIVTLFAIALVLIFRMVWQNDE